MSSSTHLMPEMSGLSHSSKNTRGRGRAVAAARTASMSALQTARQRVCAVGAADDPAEDADHLQDLGNAPLIEDDHRITAANELGGDVGLQIRKTKHQIWLERDDLVEPGVQKCGNSRLAARLGRTNCITGHANDAVAFPEQVQRFRRLLRQTHDSRRIPRGGLHSTASGCGRRARRALLSSSGILCAGNQCA